MRGACWSLKMGLFLHAVGSVSPTEPTVDGSLIHCEGVNNQSYFCEYGRCCGESQCCSYYYELWWFWLVWVIIFILCFCCICHHRRTKHRMQQQQRQHEINLIAYREAHNYPSVPFYFRFLPNYLLPEYEEVVNRPPTPPPPYTTLNITSSSATAVALAPEQHCPLQSSLAPAVPDVLCNRPPTEEPQPTAFDFRPKPDNKPLQTVQDSSKILLSDGLNVETLSSQEKKTAGGDDSCKDVPLKDSTLSEGCPGDKERLRNGRRRRFTGDSGIDVCVCSTRGSGGTGQDAKERESLLGRSADNNNEEDEDAGDFCDSCGHRASLSLEEDQALGGPERRGGRGQAEIPQAPQGVGVGSASQPVCLLLHTISEQDGPGHGADPQG